MTSTYKIPIGPLHVALEEPMYFKIELQGETIAGVEITAGHVHRGIEYLTTKRNFTQNIILTERVCSLCSNSHPSTFCMALEEIAGIEIPERAEFLRTVADETKRIASNLFNVGILAHILGFDTLFMHVMEIREIMQDVKESIFGNRMDLGANCIGGVRFDLDATQQEYLKSQLNRVEPLLKEVRHLYETNRTILSRTRGVGVLSREQALELGLVGPVARGSGVAYDVRTKAPYAAYDRLDVEVVTQPDGDIWSRAMVRIREAQVALDLLRQCMDRMPEGPVTSSAFPEVPSGEAIAKSEAPRGELIYYLRTDGTDKPARLKWRVPSYMNWSALSPMMKGNKVSDVPLIVNSIDPCISCTER
ncbi:MAG TPA: nickel-dependent hydrogenase large subunit [Candidatus Saccharimonadales bacterium]|nr:nickel-dependent hydrogenase large subunit [Candidatus Saccharimonadales bacterium]